MPPDSEITPLADPTILTTEALARAIAAQRDFVEGQIGVLEERLRGIDTATRLLNETVNRVPTALTEGLGHLQAVMDERFASIDKQFAERDTRQERESRDNKVAVDAAFAAQKEAAAKQEETFGRSIDKSESATAETIGKLQDLTSTQDSALASKIDDGLRTLADKIDDLKDGTLADLKARLAQVEGNRGGHADHAATLQAGSAVRSQLLAAYAAVFLVLVTAAGLGIALLVKP